jgi:peptidoglycan/xylan/chitin deacetylase (PgdA/CDA1 family)
MSKPARDASRRPGDTRDGKALIAITLDLEMSRHYPRRGMEHWDYEKGNLDEATRQYTVEACRRVKAAGGVLHCFLLGRTLEQENVDWLHEIIRDGHPIGNHTYDHVRLTARTARTLQHRFARCPWLLRGRSIDEAIDENIRMTEEAFQTRLGIKPRGFRTPYAFPEGLSGRRDLQEKLLRFGYSWVSSKYCQPQDLKKTSPTAANLAAVARHQRRCQPFVYPTGLVEVPLAPLSDVNAFRSRKWKLTEYHQAVRKSLAWVINNVAVYVYEAHPSVMLVEDPEFTTIDLICDMVRSAGPRAAIVDLDTIAARAAARGTNGPAR